MTQNASIASRVFACSQCPKIFATRSNLKRHMENPNIHNIPYVRSRDQKRWKGHAKKVVSKEETTERMRKWRAENREKNRQNDLRCRVYRLARQKFGEQDSLEKQQFVRDEIARRLGRRNMIERAKFQMRRDDDDDNETAAPATPATTPPAESHETKSYYGFSRRACDLVELPFYSAPQQKIELPSIAIPAPSSAGSSPALPCLSPSWRNERRTSSSSISTLSSVTSHASDVARSQPSPTFSAEELSSLPSMHSLLSYNSSSSAQSAFRPQQREISKPTGQGNVRYVDQTRILDEFVGVVLNYAGHRS